MAVLLPSVAPAEPANNTGVGLEALIHALSFEEYAVRDQAHKELLSRVRGYSHDELGRFAHHYFVANDPEVKTRLHAILKDASRVGPKPVLGLSFKDEELILKDGTRVVTMHVRRVSHGKSAQKAGILVGDRILRMGTHDKKMGAKPYAAKEGLASLPVGKKVPFHILRAGKPLVLLVRIEAAPEDNSEEARIEKEEKFAEWLEAQNPER